MPYPLGDRRIHDVDLAGIASEPLAMLKARGDQLRHLQLLRICWGEPVGESEALLNAVGAFHEWLRQLSRARNDSYAVLHFLPTTEQRDRLDQTLRARRLVAVAWLGDRLVLLGDFRQPLHAQLLDLLSEADQSIEQIAARFEDANYSHGYIGNELADLAGARVVVRRKRKPPGASRHHWHYSPPWVGSSAAVDTGVNQSAEQLETPH